jgi:hypothetical protein
VEIPYGREKQPEPLAGGKGVPGDRKSEVSHTAKAGTEEHELHRRLVKPDEASQPADVRTLIGANVCQVDAAGISQRTFVLPGEISLTTGWYKREVSRGHSNFGKRAVKELRKTHRRNEGLNIHRFGI